MMHTVLRGRFCDFLDRWTSQAPPQRASAPAAPAAWEPPTLSEEDELAVVLALSADAASLQGAAAAEQALDPDDDEAALRLALEASLLD